MSLRESLANHLLSSHPDEAAAVLETLSDEEVVATLARAGPQTASLVLPRLAPNRAATLLGQADHAVGREIIARLGLDYSASLLRRMEAGAREGLLAAVDSGVADALRALLAFPEDTAGSLMDPQVLALPEDVTAHSAIEQIRANARHIRYILFVVDRDHRLSGALNVRDLLLADRSATLGSIARKGVLAIRPSMDSTAVLNHPAWQEAPSLPVVDSNGVYLGAIRYRAWRRLAAELAVGSDDGTSTVDALGDLFWAGIAGAVGAMTNAAVRPIPGRLRDEH